MALVVIMLDWMVCHKVTDVAAEAVWDVLKTVVPAETDVIDFKKAKKVVMAYYHDRVQRVEVCPNGCIAYYDATSLPELKTNCLATKSQ